MAFGDHRLSASTARRNHRHRDAVSWRSAAGFQGTALCLVAAAISRPEEDGLATDLHQGLAPRF